VTVGGPPGAGTDLLTRTTLQLDAGASAEAVREMVRTLQRVPGVLLADLAGGDRAIVAHDAAVPTAALVAAAHQVGVRAHIVADAPSRTGDGNPGETVVLRQHARMRTMVTVTAAVFLALTFIETGIANITLRHALSMALMASLWVFFIAEAIVARRIQR
jgi:hypothetical protein